MTPSWRKFLVLGGLSLTLVVRSGVMDPKIRDMLIDKLQKVYRSLPAKDPGRVGVALRLADLLSEKARSDAMVELEKGCLECTAGEGERRQALKYYREVLPQLDRKQKSRTLAQVGHLYEMLGERNQAIKYYQAVMATAHYSDQEKEEAAISLGEIYFRKRLHALAMEQYDFVLGVKGGLRKSLASYRKAWALFNMGQTEDAIAQISHIIQTPALLVRGSNDPEAMVQYKLEIARDLATFMSKSRGGVRRAEVLYRLSPEAGKLDNVTYLASELERVGEMTKALEVYRFAIRKYPAEEQQKRFELHLRSAALECDLGNHSQGVTSYQEALRLWREMDGCQGDECGELKSRLRKFVLDWHRKGGKKAPSPLLLQSYKVYTETFPLEVDMQIWYSQGLMAGEQLREAYAAYGRSLELMTSGKGVKGTKNTEALPPLESLLLVRVELAEKIKDEGFLNEAYSAYLEGSQEKTQWVAVKYQVVYRDYKAEKYQEVAQAFKDLALMKTDQSPELRKKAADLALDSLALLKDDTRLEQWSAEFAQAFPQGAKEYRAVERKSLFNRVAQLAEENLQNSWEVLGKINVAEATRQEKMDYYRNKLILAEKLKKFPEAREVADRLLSFKGLPKKDQQFALSRKAWLAEMVFDFETALMTTESLGLSELKLSPEQKTLKLALFSELAGRSPAKYYRRYLKQIKDPKRSYAVALKLVEDSKTPLTELLRQRKILGTDKNRFALMYLNRIAGLTRKTFNKHSRLMLKDKQLAGTPSGRFLWRRRFISRYEKMGDKVSRHKISHKTQRLLSRTLTRRVKLLGQVDGLLKQAVEGQDWTAQVITLNLLHQESSRFYQEVLGLPVPEGLSPEEQSGYFQLLSQQAAPYRQQAEELSNKLAEFWGNDPGLVEQWRKPYQASTSAVRKMLAEEVRLLGSLAPEQMQGPLLAVLDYQDPVRELPKQETVVSLRGKVKQDPLNISLLNDLLEVERQFGETTMVTYLQGRIEQLKTQSSEEA